MVKKSSFFEKLFGVRKRPPRRGGAEGDSPSQPGIRKRPSNGDPAKGPEPPETGGSGEPGLAKRVPGKEEAALAILDGFKDLSRLLVGIRDRMDEQGRRAAELNEKTGELLARISSLPELLEGMQKIHEKQVAAEGRTEKTLSDFRGTMDRIHESIGALNKENQQAIKAATDSFERTQIRTTRVFEDTQRQAFRTFERGQQAHLEQISELVERSSRMNRNIVWLVTFIFGALVVLFIAVLNN